MVKSKAQNLRNDWAFYDCTALVEVELHKGLRLIGRAAFGSCSSLLHITIPSSVNGTFRYCIALVEVELHEGLRTIGRAAFRQCSSLLRINIPMSVISIGDWAFIYCQALVEVKLHEGLQRIGRAAFGRCSSLLCIIIPSSVSDIDEYAFVYCGFLRNVAISSTSAITQEQFANSFPTLHEKEITLEVIKGRFDELSLHRLCNNYNPAHGTQAKVHARCEAFIQVVNQYPIQEIQRQDCLGMTPLHILLCSGTDYDIRVIQYMIEECPDALVIQDKWGEVPLGYALLGKTSIATIDLLFATHSKRWEALPFDFGVTIERLARLGKPAQFVREVIRVQRTHFRSLVVDWQHIVAQSLSPETIACIPIGTFRVFVEASVSVRRYNCMSEDHRSEVDARIHEIKNHPHRVNVNDYEEVCEMVTRYVEAHHELLQ